MRHLLLHLWRRELKGKAVRRRLRIMVRHIAIASMNGWKFRASLSYDRACVSSSDGKDRYRASKREVRRVMHGRCAGLTDRVVGVEVALSQKETATGFTIYSPRRRHVRACHWRCSEHEPIKTLAGRTKRTSRYGKHHGGFSHLRVVFLFVEQLSKIG